MQPTRSPKKFYHPDKSFILTKTMTVCRNIHYLTYEKVNNPIEKRYFFVFHALHTI